MRTSVIWGYEGAVRHLEPELTSEAQLDRFVRR
jgi:hypothetical protein